MKHISVMIKPASALCNLRCQYCFYADVTSLREVSAYGIMKEETAQAVIENIFCDLDEGGSLLVAFQGGEPTLAGLPFFQRFAELVKAQPKKVQVSYALQTNGWLLDESWCAFLRENHFLVGLSLDGYPEVHNQYRLDPQGKGTYGKVLQAKQLMDKHRVEYNILCTLTNKLARHPQKVWNVVLKENIRYIQFTPCLGKLEGEPDEWTLTPKRFYSFYAALFPLWKQEVQKGNYISVKLFDDIVNLAVRRQVTACGMHGRCQSQHIVEADGSVYPCDFYVLDGYRGGSLADQPLHSIDETLQTVGFLDSRKQLGEPCYRCKYLQFCGGGCKRMERVMYLDDSGFCGYQKLLDEIGQELCDIGSRLIRSSSQLG